MRRSSQPKYSEVHYTVFVRVPFPRGDFVDPPAVSSQMFRTRVENHLLKVIGTLGLVERSSTMEDTVVFI